MQLGLGFLRLSSSAFWAMTPKELEAAITGFCGQSVSEPMSRSGLTDLLEQYPDEVKNGGES